MADNSVRFSETELPAVLRFLAQHYGGIGKMARRFGVDPSNLHKACKGQKPPARALLTRMGVIVSRSYSFPQVEK